MRLRKLIALLLAVLLALSTLAMVGCANDDGNDAPAATDADDADDVDYADDVGVVDDDDDDDVMQVEPGRLGTLEFWTMLTGADGVTMTAIVEDFNATNPDFTVVHRPMEAADLYMNLPLAIQSQQGVPDIALNHVERITVFQENNFLTDLTPYIAQFGIDSANYVPAAWAMTSLAGGHFGIPLDVHSFVLYVNMDLYAEHGAGELDDGILTWDEIRAAAPRLLEADLIPLPFTWLRAMFLSSYGQLNGSLASDGVNPDFNNPDAIKVFDLWQEFFRNGWTHQEGEPSWQLFLAGEAMWITEGIWMYNHVLETDLNVQMFNFPAFDPAVLGNWTSSHQFVVPRNDNLDEDRIRVIFEFIDFVGNNGIEWARAGQAPAQLSIRDDPAFAQMPQAFLTEPGAALKLYDFRHYGFAVESLDMIFGDVLWDRITPEEALEQAQRQTIERIELEGN